MYIIIFDNLKRIYAISNSLKNLSLKLRAKAICMLIIIRRVCVLHAVLLTLSEDNCKKIYEHGAIL